MFKKTYSKMGVMAFAGIIAMRTGEANAGNNFSNIAQNISTSTESIPGLLSALAYLFGILLGVLGVMKIKDHVENPTQTPLKDGAIRLASGGALFALPILFEAMSETIDAGGSGQTVTNAKLKKLQFNAS